MNWGRVRFESVVRRESLRSPTGDPGVSTGASRAGDDRVCPECGLLAFRTFSDDVDHASYWICADGHGWLQACSAAEGTGEITSGVLTEIRTGVAYRLTVGEDDRITWRRIPGT